jgi:hypothetical protein
LHNQFACTARKELALNFNLSCDVLDASHFSLT